MCKRLYPIDISVFNSLLLPLIEGNYIWKGRPPKISHYQVFCAILYVLRTGIPWRDLPPCYGNWHTIYTRFNRGNEKGVWWNMLMHLQKKRQVKLNFVLCDSTTFKYHRHGGGLKGGSKVRDEAYQD